MEEDPPRTGTLKCKDNRGKRNSTTFQGEIRDLVWLERRLLWGGVYQDKAENTQGQFVNACLCPQGPQIMT